MSNESGTEDRNGTIVAKQGDLAITTTREFNAPREKVFRAYHDPELIAQWMGPEYLKCVEVTQGTDHGSTWTLVHEDPEGQQYAFRGVVHGEATPDLSVRTFEWLGMPGNVSFEQLKFEDLGDGRSRLVGISLFPTTEDRDGMFATMEDGGLHRLDAVLETL